MAVERREAKKLQQKTIKAKSKMTKAEKKAMKKSKAQDFEVLNAGKRK